MKVMSCSMSPMYKINFTIQSSSKLVTEKIFEIYFLKKNVCFLKIYYSELALKNNLSSFEHSVYPIMLHVISS